MTPRAPEGWYHAQGDPEGTVRYWNGTSWIGGPTVGGPSHGAPPFATTLLDGPTHGYATLTAEPTVHGRVLAQAWRRVVAAIIDAVISYLVTIPLILASIDWNPDGQPRTIPLSNGMRLLPTVLIAIYTIVPVAFWGATLGKRILSTEVIRAKDGGAPGIEGAFMRYLPYLILAVVSFLVTRSRANNGYTGMTGATGALSGVALLLPIVSLILVVTDARRRSVSDRVGGTYVVMRLG
jgi:uncharacterized RDD family membrane protein YckC